MFCLYDTRCQNPLIRGVSIVVEARGSLALVRFGFKQLLAQCPDVVFRQRLSTVSPTLFDESVWEQLHLVRFGKPTSMHKLMPSPLSGHFCGIMREAAKGGPEDRAEYFKDD